MKVAVVAEFYPRAHDPVLGVWAHRQAMAAQQAGAEVEVLVLHRLVPPARTLRAGARAALTEMRTLLKQPGRTELDGVSITYVPFVSPERTNTYGTWGTWAAPPLRVALARLRRRFDYDLIHAHNAVPPADAVQRTGPRVPLITSVHGGDVFHTAQLRADWAGTVSAALNASDLVLANSSGIATACRRLTSSPIDVILLGADVPEKEPRPPKDPVLITLAHLVPRKRHADVLRAMWVLRTRWPSLRYVIVGDGPERARLEQLAASLELTDRVDFRGQLPHEQAMAALDEASLAVMPSVDEAYGVAYVESMAHGLPTIGALGEPGPLDLADLRSGIQLAAPGDVEHLSRVIDRLLASPGERQRLSKIGRRVIAANCSWEATGEATVAAYERVLSGQAARRPAALESAA
ncbi:MAG: glycosyltransferase family 4 protein [Solirubrobacteraceae bacterium]|nr:glycosyltransferase family 4 protein [Solirubrobacteraceae bacterium]